jgi:hypothetical protein
MNAVKRTFTSMLPETVISTFDFKTIYEIIAINEVKARKTTKALSVIFLRKKEIGFTKAYSLLNVLK